MLSVSYCVLAIFFIAWEFTSFFNPFSNVTSSKIEDEENSREGKESLNPSTAIFLFKFVNNFYVIWIILGAFITEAYPWFIVLFILGRITNLLHNYSKVSTGTLMVADSFLSMVILAVIFSAAFQ